MVFALPITQRCLRRKGHAGDHRPWGEVYRAGDSPPIYKECGQLLLAGTAKPVYLFWSEDKTAGSVHVGWGGSNLYRCEECDGWQGDGIEAGEKHSRLHLAEARLAAMTGLVQLLWGGLRAIVETSTDHRTIKQARIIVEEAKPLFARAFLAPPESPGSVSAGTGSVTPGDTAPLAAPSTPAPPDHDCLMPSACGFTGFYCANSKPPAPPEPTFEVRDMPDGHKAVIVDAPEPLDVEALVGAYRRAVVLWHGCDRHPGQALLDCPVGTCEEARDLLARAKEEKP